ncbi:T9SS type A sorting domain-containing protein [Taibaiella chishuiensis]|uniref:Putative secreted protein (Por secretion system target) n=1 Tax=Taibaiella chishuiensis TaxID=1434707 RepID=A0A2P8CZH3_9BACT|nr:T9SS type A sorting domain-containing protein [Taibaiella chishuiensis]PSK90369.1 putative secreted protein (Por secretion system target) [Taibaiella chishuiensis]
MKRTLKHTFFAIITLISMANNLFAQNFTSPVADEFQFGDPGVGRGALGTNCYSQASVSTGFGQADIYLSSWYNRGDGEFIFTVLPSGASTGPLFQQGYPYSGCRDLCVGYVQNKGTGQQNVLVAYYKLGVGHCLDEYDITGSTSMPLVLNTTYTLSSTPVYGRITMDTHDPLQAVVIAWEKHGTGIQTIVCQSGSWSGITTLGGTADESAPDVAYSHANGPLNAHFVYKNRNTGVVTTASLDWPLLLTVPFSNTATMAPVIEDVNTDPSAINSTSDMVIDCPDHYADEDWAYTYTDGIGVFVRMRFLGNLQTTYVNNGSLGNASLVGLSIYYAHTPTINFSGNGGIYVGWYCRYSGGDSHYIGLRMTHNGGWISSAPDYMRLPNSVASYSYPSSGMAYSKMNDFNMTICPQFMYATYFTQKPGTPGNYVLHHAFHPWFNAVFSTGAGSGYKCTGHQDDSHNSRSLAAGTPLRVHPNPFFNSLSTPVTLNEQGTVELVLTDITGRLAARQVKSVARGDQYVRLDNLDHLTVGTYSLNVIVNGKNKGSQLVVKK